MGRSPRGSRRSADGTSPSPTTATATAPRRSWATAPWSSGWTTTARARRRSWRRGRIPTGCSGRWSKETWGFPASRWWRRRCSRSSSPRWAPTRRWRRRRRRRRVHKILAVIRREFIERVRTRAFVISTVLLPLLMTTFTVLPALLLRRASGTKRVALIEGVEGSFGARAAEALLASRRRDTAAPIPFRVERLPAVGRVDAVRDSALRLTGLSRKAKTADGFDGVLVLTEETLTSGKIQYYGTNVGSIAEMRRLEGILQPVVQRERLERLGVEAGVVLKAVGRVDLVTQKVADGRLTGQSGEATFGLAYGMVFILYLTLMIYGSQVMTSVVEEKSSRIIEVLASSLKPFALLTGQVLRGGAADHPRDHDHLRACERSQRHPRRGHLVHSVLGAVRGAGALLDHPAPGLGSAGVDCGHDAERDRGRLGRRTGVPGRDPLVRSEGVVPGRGEVDPQRVTGRR